MSCAPVVARVEASAAGVLLAGRDGRRGRADRASASLSIGRLGPD